MIFRRALSTLIPPKIVSPNNLRSAPNAKRIGKVVEFYKSLPQGPAKTPTPVGVIGRYKAKYFDGSNASGKPILHFVCAIILMGYSIEYFFHLRHHKDGAEH